MMQDGGREARDERREQPVQRVGGEGGRIQARREADGPNPVGSAACTVTGPASGIYLFLWNRSDAAEADVTISGDTGFLELWQSSVRVRWN